MCDKSMGQADVCSRIMGTFVNKDEVGLLVCKAECVVFISSLGFLHYY